MTPVHGKEALTYIGHDEIKPVTQVPTDPFNKYVVRENRYRTNSLAGEQPSLMRSTPSFFLVYETNTRLRVSTLTKSTSIGSTDTTTPMVS